MTLSTGPSTNQSPYLIPSDPRVSFVSLLSAGDYVPGATIPGGKPWRFAGIADGLGAYDNCDNTITVLVNHEIGATDGIPRETGAPRGAYVDKLIIDKSSLKVLSAEELGKQLYVYDETSKSYQLKPDVLGRLCSADLPAQSALYDAKTGLGTQTRIYFNGEEVGAEGRAFAWIVDDKNEGSVYELPALGNLSFENVVASPNTGARTVVLSLDDVTGGQIYAYVGEKRAAGNEIERAGLTDGVVYGIKTEFVNEESNGQALSGNFTLSPLGDVSGKTGAELETASDDAKVTGWLRPEDGAWDTKDPNRFYFVTTNAFDAPSRLWALDFKDVTRPELGGKYTALLDGTEGQQMLDNITVSQDGTLVLQEDPGNQTRAARVWSYDPKTDGLTEIARHDPNRFGDETKAATPPFNQDEESSGVIDVTGLFDYDDGRKIYLLDTQAHYKFGDEGSFERQQVVEGGQLQLMQIMPEDHDDSHGSDDHRRKDDDYGKAGRHDDSRRDDDKSRPAKEERWDDRDHARIDHHGLTLKSGPDFVGWYGKSHDKDWAEKSFQTLDGDAPLVIGHRGASGSRPEHTLESYRLAVDLGADFIEPDLVPTKDGYLIARHEPELSGTTDIADRPEFADRHTTKIVDGVATSGWFAEDLTLAEIKTLYARERIPQIRPDNTQFNDQYRIPTLEEIIGLVKQIEHETGKEICIIPETKHPTYFKYEGQRLDGSYIHTDTSQLLIDTLVKTCFTDYERVVIQSFEVANLIDLQNRIMPNAHVDVQLVQLLNEGGYDITFNFDPTKQKLGADPDAYRDLKFELSPNSVTNGDLYDPKFLRAIAELYAEAIGPYKDDILPTKSLTTPVDGNGDGVAEITRQYTGKVTSLVQDAHKAGLMVVPYTLRDEEVFQTLRSDGSVQDVTDEYRKLIDLGVDGFFTDFPGTGREVVDDLQQHASQGAGWHPAISHHNVPLVDNWAN